MSIIQRTRCSSAVVAAALMSACATVQPVENIVRVPRPFPEVLNRVSVGMESEIKHGMTFTKDAVKYRREDITPDVIRFDLWTWALDLGDRAVFAHIDVMRASKTSTNIRIREESTGSGSKPYLTEKIRSWFPDAR